MLTQYFACYFRTLRAICRQAELQKLLMNVHHLFNGLFMGYEETRKRALNIEQLRKVADADLKDAPI